MNSRPTPPMFSQCIIADLARLALQRGILSLLSSVFPGSVSATVSGGGGALLGPIPSGGKAPSMALAGTFKPWRKPA
jgi:hypothetical protein